MLGKIDSNKIVATINVEDVLTGIDGLLNLQHFVIHEGFSYELYKIEPGNKNQSWVELYESGNGDIDDAVFSYRAIYL